MGMFDNVKCDYKLPWPESADFGFDWQTKDTAIPYLDRYEIRADGTLWYEQHDKRFETNDDTVLGIVLYRDNQRWEQVQWEGEFEIHHWHDDWWYEVRFWFRGGIVIDSIATRMAQPQPQAEAQP